MQGKSLHHRPLDLCGGSPLFTVFLYGGSSPLSSLRVKIQLWLLAKTGNCNLNSRLAKIVNRLR
jgi:hypothetical protein